MEMIPRHQKRSNFSDASKVCKYLKNNKFILTGLFVFRAKLMHKLFKSILSWKRKLPVLKHSGLVCGIYEFKYYVSYLSGEAPTSICIFSLCFHHTQTSVSDPPK